MAKDEVVPILIIGLMYGWPILVGVLCFIRADILKGKAALGGILIGAGCLLAAVVTSLLIVLAIESWVVPVSNSPECIGGLPSCPTWLLQIAEIIDDWHFLVLEVAAIVVAVWLSLRRLRPFNK
uniref:Uncharacterized protein n=1 Tax=Marinobacter nauticus TaxID=2743 RepID=A0A455WBY5_MARNT|nr:hypothetical protein YBY_12100 [Marinobacter nauticus]